MRVKEIEIIGFKSFVDKAKLSFNPGITALVGPNGCGKSNIMDAFRWIMGEQNARNLRGKIMEDLIFNGSETRKPLGMAEVSMILTSENGSSNSQPISEVMVTRRLYRSGESEYFINKIPCRLKDIVELFLDSGVGVKSYSIMEQGRVDHILSLKPPERRILIEEVAGIAKYRARKKEALSKMESTKMNLLRIRDILNEIQNQLAILEKQVKRLNRYRKIKEEIKELDLLLASHKFQLLTETDTKLSNEIATLKDEEIRIETQTKSAEAQLEENRLLLTETNQRINELQRTLYEIKNKIGAEENRLEYNKRELLNTIELKDKYIRNLEELKQELASLDSDIASRQSELDTVNAQIAELQEAYILGTESASQLKNNLTRLQERIEKEKAELITIVTNRSQIKNSIQVNLNQQRDLTLRLSKLESETETCRSRLSEVAEKGSVIEKQLGDITVLKDNKQTEVEVTKNRIDGLSLSLLKKDSELNELKENTGIVRSRLISLKELQKNYEGFDNGVRTVMSKPDSLSFEPSSIKCLLADIIETSPEYETLVEAVLGRTLQSVLVPRHNDCIELIDYLKQQNSGRVSFIPLTLREIASAENRPMPQNETVIPLISLIKTSTEYQPLVNILFQDVYLVNNITHALSLWESEHFSATFVTSEGEIIEPEGIITGGGKSTIATGILQRNREIKQLTSELAELEIQLQAMGEERIHTAQELHDAQELLETINQDKHNLEIQFIQLESNKKQFLEEAQQCRDKIELVQVEKESYAGELITYQQELKELIIQEGSFKFNDDERQRTLKEHQSAEVTLQDDVKNAEAHTVEVRVKLELSQQKHASLLENMNNLLNAQMATRVKADSMEHEIQGLHKNQETIAEEIKQGEESLFTLIGKNTELEAESNTEKEKAKSKEEAIAVYEESIRELHKLREEIEPKVHTIDLDLKEVTLRFEHLNEELAEKYSCSVQELPPPPDVFNQDEYQDRLEKLKYRLENIGEVNLAAAHEYGELKKRFDFLTTQEQDLTQSLESLQKVIAKINRTTREKFQEIFTQVNQHFQEVFPMLFDGGKAYLSLTDESDLLETGIEIFAQPPGKKLQSLDLLSGGERSLTVVALLFAIFLTKPSPFCLLDEIDAALDDSNIDRFNQHLQKMSGKSQFIMVTHSKQSMQVANTLYGITMQERGVSKIVSVEMH